MVNGALRWAVAMCAALAAGVAGGWARAEVWAVDDSVRVDPQDGEIIESRHPAGDAVGPDYRESNPVWDAARGTIELLAAGDEVVAFQVVVDGGPHTGLSLAVDDLVGPGGAVLTAAGHVRRFREWYVNVRRESEFCDRAPLVTSLGTGWYPDPLVPLDEPVGSGFGQPFDVPDARNAVPGQTAAAFWVDVLVPAGTRAGRYSGAVRVAVDGDEVVLPLALVVRGFDLPAANRSGVGSINYGGLSFEVWHADGDPAGLIPWYQAFHAHRLELDALWMWPPRVPGDTDGHFDEWREAMRPFFSGAAFTAAHGYHGPAVGQPVRRFTMPNESNFPGPHFSWDDPRPVDEAAWQAALREVEAILIDEGWTGLEAHLFVNGVDEPRDVETFERVAYYGELVDGAGLVDRDHVLFRLDAGQLKNIGAHIPGWSTERIFAEVGDAVDVWNENGGPAYVDLAATRRRLAEHPDERFWVYSTCSAGEPAMGSVAIEGEALGLRTWGWIVARYGLDGAVSWEMDGMRHDIDARRCWTDPQCAGWGINGDAVLLYLGEHVGLAGRPVTSIRFKSLRRGSQDHEYLRLLRAIDPDAAEAHAAEIVPRALDDGLTGDGSAGRWSHDPARYEAVRRAIADVLDDAGPVDPDGGPGDAGADADADSLDADVAADGGSPGGGDDGCGCRAAGRVRADRAVPGARAAPARSWLARVAASGLLPRAAYSQ